MKTRRLAYWWFWLVASGRFLEKFLALHGIAVVAFDVLSTDDTIRRDIGRAVRSFEAARPVIRSLSRPTCALGSKRHPRENTGMH